MYNKLVKRLRDAAKTSETLAVLPLHSKGNATAKLYNKAADAIEELSKPRWIPVTERLPETGEYVLVRYKNNDMAVACLFDRDENSTFWGAQIDEGWCADCGTEPPKEG